MDDAMLGALIVAQNPYRIHEMADHAASWQRMSDWLCDPRVSRHYGGEHYRFSPEQARAHYRPRVLGTEPVQGSFLVWQERAVGFLQYYEVPDPMDYQISPDEVEQEGLWALDLFIGEPELWGQGHGRAFISLMVTHLFESCGASRVWIDPFVGNTRAIRAYQACGFEPIKRLIAHEEHDGVMQDCLLMCHGRLIYDFDRNEA